MANRYWVGGSGTWDATNTANWSATSGGAGGASVPGSADTVTFNAASGAVTVTLGYNPTVQTINFTGFTGTFNGVGSSYTITLNSTGSVWTAVSGMTLNGAPNITLSDTSATARTFTTGGKTYGNVVIGGSTGSSNTTITGTCTIGTLSSTKTVAHTVTFATTNTYTISNWSITGSAGNVVTVTSSSATSAATVVNVTNRTSGIDYLDVIAIRSSNVQPITFYVGANSTIRQSVLGVAAVAPTANEYIYVLTSGISWTTPADWNNSNNEIHLFGGGAGGAGGYFNATRGGGGGGGGG